MNIYEDYMYFRTEKEIEADKKRYRENAWFRKSSLKPLGKKTALAADLNGFKTIEELREAMERDLVNTLGGIISKLNVGRSRHQCRRILKILDIEVPKKPIVTCKCCGQSVYQRDAIDNALDLAT